MPIPRIIHQSWVDQDLITYADGSIGIRSQASLKRCYPNFIYKLWTDNDIELLFEHAELRQFKEAYERLPKKIMKIDFSRYLFMYIHGGLYFDLDCISSNPITKNILKSKDFIGYKARRRDDIFGSDYIKYLEKNNGGSWAIGQAFFGCKRRCPLLMEAIELISKDIIENPHLFDHKNCENEKQKNSMVLFRTGPDLLNKVFIANNSLFSEEVHILDHSEFDNDQGDIGYHCRMHNWERGKDYVSEHKNIERLIETNKNLVDRKAKGYSKHSNNEVSQRPLIIIASEKRTGSTLLANIVAGLISKDQPIPFTARFSPKSIPQSLVESYPLIKTHELSLKAWENRLKPIKRDCVFIIPFRGINNLEQLNKDLSSKILLCDYNEFTSEGQLLIFFVEKMLKFLKEHGATQGNKELIKNSINRVVDMNYTNKYIEDKPFDYIDVFYQVHGGHRKKWGQKHSKLTTSELTNDKPNKLKRIMQIPGHYSQYGQDSLIGDILFRGKPGFFVDVGARCGRKISNTYYLENKLSWEGILVEPHPELFSQCKSNRKSITYNYAVSDVNGELDFVCYNQEPKGNSGLLNTFRNPNILSSISHKIITVKTQTLSDILEDADAPMHIDYLDIDVEGHELNVLKSIDFKRYSFSYIGCETDPNRPSMQWKEISELLYAMNYSPIFQIGSDIIFGKQTNQK
ncbi:FkbM family methyltransferase [Synechococcus sp. AH-601-B19]|nr:FkbM family methyltransferase [Synechococcus sp. AH-601-B19]